MKEVLARRQHQDRRLLFSERLQTDTAVRIPRLQIHMRLQALTRLPLLLQLGKRPLRQLLINDLLHERPLTHLIFPLVFLVRPVGHLWATAPADKDYHGGED